MEKILQLVVEPDPRLHIPSKAVDQVNDEVRQLMDSMLATMYKSEGIGLAAVQVGVDLKVVVIDIDQTLEKDFLHDQKPIYMVNPEIVEKSEETVIFCEGCLSLPTVRADVVRNEWIVVEYLDYEGKKKKEKFTGLLSICAQHEIDHTNGIIFIDHLSRLKKEFFMKKLIKLRKQMGNE
jgi:peptide deformylase